MDSDFDGAIGRAMALSAVEDRAKAAQQGNVELFKRIARIERLFVLATMGGKDAQAETNKILQNLIREAAT